MKRYRKLLLPLLLICCLFVTSMPVSAAKSSTTYTTSKVASKTYKNRWGIKKISKSDAKLLAQIVYLEARGEGDKGERAVIEVVFNRVNSKKFPNSIKKVLSQKGQFSTYKYRNKAKVRSKELRNIYKVLNGDSHILSKKVVFFGTRPYNKKVELKYKHHYFCRY